MSNVTPIFTAEEAQALLNIAIRALCSEETSAYVTPALRTAAAALSTAMPGETEDTAYDK